MGGQLLFRLGLSECILIRGSQPATCRLLHVLLLKTETYRYLPHDAAGCTSCRSCPDLKVYLTVFEEGVSVSLCCILLDSSVHVHHNWIPAERVLLYPNISPYVCLQGSASWPSLMHYINASFKLLMHMLFAEHFNTVHATLMRSMNHKEFHTIEMVEGICLNLLGLKLNLRSNYYYWSLIDH